MKKTIFATLTAAALTLSACTNPNPTPKLDNLPGVPAPTQPTPNPDENPPMRPANPDQYPENPTYPSNPNSPNQNPNNY